MVEGYIICHGWDVVFKFAGFVCDVFSKLFLTVFFLASGFKMFQVICAVQPYLDIFDKSTRTVNDNFPSFKFRFPGCAYSRCQ